MAEVVEWSLTDYATALLAVETPDEACCSRVIDQTHRYRSLIQDSNRRSHLCPT